MLAVVLYISSVFAMEFFYFIPILLILGALIVHRPVRQSMARVVDYSRSIMAWYLVPIAILGYLAFVSRKNFMAEGAGIVGKVFSLTYAKSVLGQLTSNLGDRFFMFLADNLYLYGERLSAGTRVYLLAFSAIVTGLFIMMLWIRPLDPMRLRREISTLIGVGVAIVVLAALTNSVAGYTYSLGYGEDRINQASALGATMTLTGILMFLGMRSGIPRMVGALCCYAMIFATASSAALQAQDWRLVRSWEVQLARDYQEFLTRHPEAAGEKVVVLHGFPRYVSSFEFDRAYIWLAYAYPRLNGRPGPYYRVPVVEIEGKRGHWSEKIKRHFDRGYRFWPMLLAPVHPIGESLKTRNAVKIVHVDSEFGIGCTEDGIVLPLSGGEEITPVEVDHMLFGVWSKSEGTTFRQVSARGCRSVAAAVNQESS
jgi:hypothetical protein